MLAFDRKPRAGDALAPAPKAARHGQPSPHWFAMPLSTPARTGPSSGMRDGQRLDVASRSWAERAFNSDFSNVRVRSDSAAASAASSLGAAAFTIGSDVYFGGAVEDLTTGPGRHLLAHELTHVVQQKGRSVDPSRMEPVNSDAEHEARATASRIASGDSAPPLHAAPVGVARDVGWASRGPIPDAYGMGYNDIFRRAGASSQAAVLDLASCEGTGLTFDRAHFDSLPTARRTAVLALRPHATGTACEAWFKTLALSTSGGEFTVEKYKEHESAAGDVDKFVGTEIKLRFTPSVNTISDKIGFVQVLRPIVLFANEAPRATTASDAQAGWALDRMAGRRSPIYGQENAGTAAGNTHFGFRRSATDMDPAWMSDRTNEERLKGQSLAFEGTTYALDDIHSKYLGGVYWGFDVSAAGTVKNRPITIQSLVAPQGIQLRALELWNVQAANTNPALRNDPKQDKVPIP
jgi:hypothetical protein